MQESIAERTRKLRAEIAKLNAAHAAYLKAPKYGSVAADNQRRMQRLQEILDDLKSLDDWKKL
jgi:hypothetical protein